MPNSVTARPGPINNLVFVNNQVAIRGSIGKTEFCVPKAVQAAQKIHLCRKLVPRNKTEFLLYT